MNKAERHAELCESLNDIYIKKNKIYGDAFGKTCKELGLISAITRMYDKFNRLLNLFKGNPDTVGEAMEDTLMDLANYCLMTIMEMESYKNEGSNDNS